MEFRILPDDSVQNSTHRTTMTNSPDYMPIKNNEVNIKYIVNITALIMLLFILALKNKVLTKKLYKYLKSQDMS